MQSATAVIDRLLDDHKSIRQNIIGLGKMVNDNEIATAIENIKAAGLKNPEEQSDFKSLYDQLCKTELYLAFHFSLEETDLMSAAEKCGNKKVVSALNRLILEHDRIRSQMGDSVKDFKKLANEPEIVNHQRTQVALAHLSGALNLLKEHAESEDSLLLQLRRELGQ